MVYSGQRFFGLAISALLLIITAEAKPQYYETNEIDHISSPGQTYIPFYAYQVLNRYPDIENEKLRLFLEAKQNSDDDAMSGAIGDNLLRKPMTKRQAVRYRQCYFNPISCFRK